MKNSVFIAVLFSLIFSPEVRAWGTEDFTAELASPLTTDAKYIVIGGGVLTLAAVVLQHNTQSWHDRTAKDQPLGHWAHYGDIAGQLLPNALYIAGQSFAAYQGDSKAKRRAWNMLKATAYSGGVTTALKYTIRQPRPGNAEKNSFPSGHSTTAFAFAGHVLDEHGAAWGVPALGLAALVGYSRINDNRHYLHDVLAGATIGLAYGMGINKLNSEGKGGVTVVPLYDTEIFGLAFMKEI